MSRLIVRTTFADNEPRAVFSINPALSRQQLVELLAGKASWHSDIDTDADKTQDQIIELIRDSLLVDGVNAVSESSEANADHTAWAERQIEKVWPKK